MIVSSKFTNLPMTIRTSASGVQKSFDESLEERGLSRGILGKIPDEALKFAFKYFQELGNLRPLTASFQYTSGPNKVFFLSAPLM